MSWELIRRRRLPLHFLRGTWTATALTTPGEFDSDAKFVAWIELHPLRFSADTGLHTVSIANTDPEAVVVDHWSADLDIDEQGQMIAYPFWNLDRFFEQDGQRPIEAVRRPDDQALILTAWHGWDRITPRQFKLIKVSDEL